MENRKMENWKMEKFGNIGKNENEKWRMENVFLENVKKWKSQKKKTGNEKNGKLKIGARKKPRSDENTRQKHIFSKTSMCFKHSKYHIGCNVALLQQKTEKTLPRASFWGALGSLWCHFGRQMGCRRQFFSRSKFWWQKGSSRSRREQAVAGGVPLKQIKDWRLEGWRLEGLGLEARLEAGSQKEQLDTPSAKARWRIAVEH